jgi:cytochrome c
MIRKATVLVLSALGAAGASAADPSGADIYRQKCGSCHSLAANRVGPAHKGVFGRRAGLVPGYAYSPALKGSGIVWNEKTLDQWLAGPQKMAKGSKMFFTVPSAEQRAAIIGYLKSPAAR